MFCIIKYPKFWCTKSCKFYLGNLCPQISLYLTRGQLAIPSFLALWGMITKFVGLF